MINRTKSIFEINICDVYIFVGELASSRGAIMDGVDKLYYAYTKSLLR